MQHLMMRRFLAPLVLSSVVPFGSEPGVGRVNLYLETLQSRGETGPLDTDTLGAVELPETVSFERIEPGDINAQMSL